MNGNILRKNQTTWKLEIFVSSADILSVDELRPCLVLSFRRDNMQTEKLPSFPTTSFLPEDSHAFSSRF